MSDEKDKGKELKDEELDKVSGGVKEDGVHMERGVHIDSTTGRHEDLNRVK